ncbi:cytochrome P450 3A [Sarcoptes scabiei]|nr:cytochrome P450 3A [Sarcoptes scabiei]
MSHLNLSIKPIGSSSPLPSTSSSSSSSISTLTSLRNSTKITYVYQLPYNVRKNICDLLDADNSWRDLGGRFMGFDGTQLALISHALYRNSSPTNELLSRWESTNAKICHLFLFLSQMKHQRAMYHLLPFISDRLRKQYYQTSTNNNAFDGDCEEESSRIMPSSFPMNKETIMMRMDPIDYGSRPESSDDFVDLNRRLLKIKLSKKDSLGENRSNYQNVDPLLFQNYSHQIGRHEFGPKFNNKNETMHGIKNRVFQNGDAEQDGCRNDITDLLDENNKNDTVSIAENFRSSNDHLRISTNQNNNKNPNDTDPDSDAKTIDRHHKNTLPIDEQQQLRTLLKSDAKKRSPIGLDDGRKNHPRKSKHSISEEQCYMLKIDDFKIAYKELAECTEDFSKSNILGSGGFGTVFIGTWKGTKVAIKKLKGLDNITQAFTELRILNCCRIDNILPLYAVSLDGPEPCLVYQFMPNGSLEDRLLCKNHTSPLTWKQRTRIGEGVARALNFLHTLKGNPYVHGDVKSANILLDALFEPKLGDFGLARQIINRNRNENSIYTHCTVTSVNGTSVYLPAEYLRNKILSPAVDVYSYGVVILEMATGKRAYDGKKLLINSVEDDYSKVRQANLNSHQNQSMHVNNERGTNRQNHRNTSIFNDCNPFESMMDQRIVSCQQDRHLFSYLLELGRRCANKIKSKRPIMIQILEYYNQCRETDRIHKLCDKVLLQNKQNQMMKSNEKMAITMKMEMAIDASISTMMKTSPKTTTTSIMTLPTTTTTTTPGSCVLNESNLKNPIELQNWYDFVRKSCGTLSEIVFENFDAQVTRLIGSTDSIHRSMDYYQHRSNMEAKQFQSISNAPMSSSVQPSSATSMMKTIEPLLNSLLKSDYSNDDDSIDRSEKNLFKSNCSIQANTLIINNETAKARKNSMDCDQSEHIFVNDFQEQIRKENNGRIDSNLSDCLRFFHLDKQENSPNKNFDTISKFPSNLPPLIPLLTALGMNDADTEQLEQKHDP